MTLRQRSFRRFDLDFDTTPHSDQLQSAISAAVALGGGDIYLSEEAVFAEAISLRSGVHLFGRRTTIRPATTWAGSLTDPTNAFIKALGAFDTAKLNTTHSGSLTIPTLSMTASSVAGATLAASDWILIGDDGAAIRRAQLVQVGSGYAGGTTIPLVASPIVGSPSGTTIRGWTPVTGIGVHDIDFVRGAVSVAAGVYFRGVAGYQLSGLRYDSFPLGVFAAEDYGSIRGAGPGLKLFEPGNRWLPNISIMPLGDSRAGQGTPADWQGYLYLRLVRELYGRANVRFVGTDNAGTNPLFAEAHPGFTILQLNTNIATYLNTARPDIVVIQAGINDIAAGANGVLAAIDMGTLVTSIRTNAWAAPRVIVSTLWGWDSRFGSYSAGKETERVSFNTGATALLGQFSPPAGSAQHKSYVTLADCHAGFDSLTMNSDGVHQNALGAVFVADRIYDNFFGGYEI